ncbi:hypothetical protein LOTGIDRAFT_156279 [Lottia gigantea]|uniref:DUF4456 domain-containing protein n=1 Tax=Lottia gigantea TaxID=225164 RepID=V4ALF0_LOTGI|nr:hypothetical protein LOTGIDRAFT_156279 [Lottia gigantea]ESP05024.1 hypothetical protein LOTGIDRAFT_156279 [Lottia gigantea]
MTEKGTTFYVLSVPGKQGVQPDPVNQDVPKSPSIKRKPYIESVDIPKSLINDIKRQIRVNFLNHLETWLEQAVDKSSSVVVAKCEELNSELDLRLHLHQPRPRRAELDIHNVRAAELVMHSERVSRHSKGIQQSLSDLRTRFNGVSQEHNKLAHKFREDIEALEIVFINATKSSRLMALQNQLGVELEKFMSVIRTSLRQFRQHLDKNLQMLRESNARFIKSFKLFSDGGNFCPQEIEEYRKSLEKMSQKIDQVEGSIMSDLEGMESKRLEQGSKVAIEFEDRFKSHMFDLVFMEKIARWLTNTQVKIKTEVADSNTQAQTITRHIQQLDRRIDACENPNPDKEQIRPEEIYESLPVIYMNIAKRAEFLHCIKDAPPRPSSGSILQGNPATAARVGFISDITPISKPGRPPTEDPSLNVIKSILKPQKDKVDPIADYSAEIMPHAAHSNVTVIAPPDSREKLKSAMSVSSGKGSTTSSIDRKVSGRRSQVAISEQGHNKRIHSATMNSVLSVIPDKMAASFHRDSLALRNQRTTRFERRFYVFGEKEEEGETEYFTGIVKKLLREALEGLLITAELYYKTKGNRAVTRPQALQDNFDSCADTVILKLQSYYKQAFEYHNECLQEFRKQLREFEELVARLPWLVLGEIESQQKQNLETERKNIENKFSELFQQLKKQQTDHQNELRPSLGHPHQQPELDKLCEKEKKRHEEYLQLVQTQLTELKASLKEQSKKFIETIARAAENQLSQYDNITVVDEVQVGRVPPRRYPTQELMRRKAAGESLEDGEEGEIIPRGKGTWPGLPNNELIVDPLERADEVEYTATVTTLKTTLGHQAVVMCREQAYEHYQNLFERTLKEIHIEKEKLLKSEERWMDSWQKSVQKVKNLY